MRIQSDGKQHLGQTLDYAREKSFPGTEEAVGDVVDDPPLKILPLGGLGEIGMNCMLVGSGDRYVLLDAGLMFPECVTTRARAVRRERRERFDARMGRLTTTRLLFVRSHEELGIQKVLPDVSFLARWRDKIEAVLITHGHEDHIGALPWVVPALDPSTPIYAGLFTMQLIKRRMQEFSLWNDKRFKVFEMNERFQAGPFDMEAVRVTHSIPDCCGLIFRSEHGTIVHTGDWKIDENPVDGRHFDRESWERVGKEGVTLMMSDSTNVLSPGRTVSESTVSEGIMRRVLGHRGRIITTQFASNIHRLYGVRAAAEATGRQIAFIGMSLTTYLEAAKRAGIAPLDPANLVPADEIDNCDPSKLLIVTTGSQGEDRAQLALAANGSSRLLTLQQEDLLLYSAKMIPGNEKRVMRMMNEIAKRGPEIAMGREDCLHSSGHGYKEELDEVIKLLKPEHFLPVHGEYAFLRAHEQLARQSGVQHTTVIGNGEMLGITPLRKKKSHGTMGNFHRMGKAKLQTMFNDGGWGSGTSEDLAIEERMRIAVEGIIVCDYEISNDGNNLIHAKARVTSRGMWTDDGRLLESVRSAAIAASADMPIGTKLSTVERAISSAIRFAVKNYCNKRPDVIVVAHRAGQSSRPIPDVNAMSAEDDDASGQQKRYPRRNMAPTDVSPLRGDYKGPGPSGDSRHMRRDSEYQ